MTNSLLLPPPPMGEGIAFSLSQIKRMCFDIYGGDSMSKHMNLSDRTTIEQRLCAGVSIRQITKELGKAPSTISRKSRDTELYPTRADMAG